MSDPGRDPSILSTNSQPPQSKILELRVIEPQPSLVLKSLSLPQPSVMLLEGEDDGLRAEN